MTEEIKRAGEGTVLAWGGERGGRGGAIGAGNQGKEGGSQLKEERTLGSTRSY